MTILQRRTGLTVVIVTCAAWLAGAVETVGAQGRLTANYTISAAGVTIGRLTWSVDVGTTRYASSAFGKASGVLSVLLNGEGSAASQGIVEHGRLVPVTFISAITDDEGNAELRITFDKGAVTDLVAPPPGKQPRVPLKDADLVGVSDPLSAVLLPVEPSGDPLAAANCGRVLSIFDGRRRYDLALSFRRVDKVAIKGFSGHVLVCGAVLKPISGQRTDSLMVKLVAGRTDLEAWFAAIPGAGILAPVRVSVPTMLGTLAVSADQFDATLQPAR